LDKINDVELEFEGDIEDIIYNPINWGEEQADRIISENIYKYLESKELGEEFYAKIKDQI
tara:strand:- start:359 stop:538 length:180 start_codon:yes stop_codon:yes gene_type:complete